MERLPIEQGPMIEQTQLTAGLDFYKLTMSQVQFEQHPNVQATFTLKNRGSQRLANYVNVEELSARFEQIRETGFAPIELDRLAALNLSNGERMFSDEYLTYLATNELPAVNLRIDEKTNDIACDVTGQWPMTTFWETIVMSELSEAYFRGFVQTEGLDIEEVYAEGDRRFDEWTQYMQANPDDKIAEFGTRRRFSLRWQKHIVERVMTQNAVNYLGSSNVALSGSMGTRPVGTFAHEMPMGYAGIADALGEDVRASHNKMQRDWWARYGHDLSTALSDTFTSDFFFEDFTQDQADTWKGTRHDSGDPLEYMDKAEAYYLEMGVDPRVKTIFFSDGLNVKVAARIHEAARSRINDPKGVGTNWTNNMGEAIKPLNIVMKLTHVRLPDGREADTVKLSDNPGKHTGSDALVRRYAEEVFSVKQDDLEHRSVLV